MKNINIYAAFTVLTIMCSSCNGAKSDKAADVGGGLATSAVSNGVEIEYSSANAINAPEYDPDSDWGMPLALADGLNHSMDGFPIVDSGAYPDGGKIVYSIFLVNQGQDTVTISSIKLPDSSMTIDWTGVKTYRPGMLSIFKLVCDRGVMQDDYRFILTYEGDKYSPQVFHVNLRPDISEMIAEREAKNQ